MAPVSSQNLKSPKTSSKKENDTSAANTTVISRHQLKVPIMGTLSSKLIGTDGLASYQWLQTLLSTLPGTWEQRSSQWPLELSSLLGRRYAGSIAGAMWDAVFLPTYMQYEKGIITLSVECMFHTTRALTKSEQAKLVLRLFGAWASETLSLFKSWVQPTA